MRVTKKQIGGDGEGEGLKLKEPSRPLREWFISTVKLN